MWNHIGIIIVVNLIAYMRSLKYPWISDDIAVSKQPIEIKSYLHGVWLQFFGLKYFNTRQAHLIRLYTHIINCVLIYVMFGSNPTSLLAATLFAINPINNQGVIWCSGGRYQISATLVLLMFMFPLLSPLFYYLTNAVVISSLFMPLVFIPTKLWFYSFMIIPFAFLIKRKMKQYFSKRMEQQSNAELSSVHPRKLIPFIKTYGYYLGLTIFPCKLGMYHNFMYSFGVDDEGNRQGYKLNLSFWLGLVAVIASIVIVIIDWGGYYCFGVTWFAVGIAMWCNYVTSQQAISERYAYLPAIGIMAVLAKAIVAMPYTAVTASVFITYYLTRLFYYIPAYSGEFWFNEYNLIEFKDHYYVWNNRGIRKYAVHDMRGALHNFMTAREFAPKSFKVNFNIAQCMLLLGDVAQAKAYLDIAEKDCTIDGRDELLSKYLDESKHNILEVEAGLKSHGSVRADLNKIQLLR